MAEIKKIKASDGVEYDIYDSDAIHSLESVTLTGTPTAPTAASGTNTTQIATTAFVYQELQPYQASIVANTKNSGYTYSNGYIYIVKKATVIDHVLKYVTT